MKQWKKIVCIAAAMLVICAAIVFLSGNRKECCLCNNPNYSVPCLVDLDTGDILELNLDGPSATYDGHDQSGVETFSFIRFGNVTGTKQTAPGIIELKIPTADKMNIPALCRKLLLRGSDGRYALADLENKVLFPISANGELIIQGHRIIITHDEDHICITICWGLHRDLLRIMYNATKKTN